MSQTAIRTWSIFMFVCAYTRNGWNSDRFQALERPKDVTEWRTVPNLAALLCSTNGWAISNTNYSFTQTLLQALPMRFTQEKKRHKCVKITHRICYMSIPMSTGVAGSNPDSGSPPASPSILHVLAYHDISHGPLFYPSSSQVLPTI